MKNRPDAVWDDLLRCPIVFVQRTVLVFKDVRIRWLRASGLVSGTPLHAALDGRVSVVEGIAKASPSIWARMSFSVASLKSLPDSSFKSIVFLSHQIPILSTSPTLMSSLRRS